MFVNTLYVIGVVFVLMLIALLNVIYNDYLQASEHFDLISTIAVIMISSIVSVTLVIVVDSYIHKETK